MLQIITNDDKSMFGIASDDLSEFFTGFDVNGNAHFSKNIGECATWENVMYAKAQKHFLDNRADSPVMQWRGPIHQHRTCNDYLQVEPPHSNGTLERKENTMTFAEALEESGLTTTQFIKLVNSLGGRKIANPTLSVWKKTPASKITGPQALAITVLRLYTAQNPAARFIR